MSLVIFGARDQFYDDRGAILMRIFDDFVMFVPDDMLPVDPDVAYHWTCCVIKLPFVPGFHLVDIEDGKPALSPYLHIIATYKTMHEAMGVLRVLWANGGLVYE
jgi:hypothetical protein